MTRPENVSTAALPAANTASEMPASWALCCVKTCATNSGRIATRTPKFVQPFANPDTSAARYVGEPSASRTVSAGTGAGVAPAASPSALASAARRRTRASEKWTIAAATTSAPPYRKKGTR
ncbi:hypothetical protein GCM10022377_02770 [Zhihengliuella alba]|uniref:Uncharacterized protein n=1 Tax=Zhihengliuella alba TaxID=547018 RepID=A0ABP7CRJ2_9MICC